jgi:hypothetical protein
MSEIGVQVTVYIDLAIGVTIGVRCLLETTAHAEDRWTCRIIKPCWPVYTQLSYFQQLDRHAGTSTMDEEICYSTEVRMQYGSVCNA